ncbi:uncharacterized protein LOC134539675 [Bacillus rossius redtenbacheri]|uniref:uncharacterized protein LOC134539675 n=1 Tax=Bacillus rossius redtenbacheri TaxID=93214 RepID=UPI002FDEF78D
MPPPATEGATGVATHRNGHIATQSGRPPCCRSQATRHRYGLAHHDAAAPNCREGSQGVDTVQAGRATIRHQGHAAMHATVGAPPAHAMHVAESATPPPHVKHAAEGAMPPPHVKHAAEGAMPPPHVMRAVEGATLPQHVKHAAEDATPPPRIMRAAEGAATPLPATLADLCAPPPASEGAATPPPSTSAACMVTGMGHTDTTTSPDSPG